MSHGGQLTSSGYNAVALPPFGTDDQQTWEQALHYIEHVLGVTPLPQGLWQDTCEWNQLKSACQAGSTDTDHDKTESLLYRWFIRLPPPHNDRFECQVPVNDDRSAYCKATMHKKWRILSHIRSHLQYRPFACNGQCGVPTCQYGATNVQQLRLHIDPEVRECQGCRTNILRQNLLNHQRTCPARAYLPQ